MAQSGQSWGQDQENHPKYRTKTCHYWIKGTCRSGDRCKYLHSIDENIDIATPSPPSNKRNRRDRATSLTTAVPAAAQPFAAMGSFGYSPGSNMPVQIPTGRYPSSYPNNSGFNNAMAFNNQQVGYNYNLNRFNGQQTLFNNQQSPVNYQPNPFVNQQGVINQGPSLDWATQQGRNQHAMGQQTFYNQESVSTNYAQVDPQAPVRRPSSYNNSQQAGGYYNNTTGERSNDNNNNRGGRRFIEPFSNNGPRRRPAYVPAGQQSEGFVKNYNKPCHHWLKGSCTYGANCKYLHQNQKGINQMESAGNNRPAKPYYRGKTILDGTGHVLAEIKASELKQDSEGTIGMSNYELVTSYSWAEETNSISVPGAPLRYVQPAMPLEVSPDKGTIIVDHNEFKHPNFPLEPIFRSLSAAVDSLASGQTTLNDFMSSFDVVSDRNNLRKLLAFATGGHSKGGEALRSFRIDFTLIDGTMYLQRWNEKPAFERYGTLGQRQSFGQSFKNAVMVHDDEGLSSNSHHRIVKYNLGGTKILMRFEVDGIDGSHGRLEEEEIVTTTSPESKANKARTGSFKDKSTLPVPVRPTAARSPSAKDRVNKISDYIKRRMSIADEKEKPPVEPPRPVTPVFDNDEDTEDLEGIVNAVQGMQLRASPNAAKETEPKVITAPDGGLTVIMHGKHVPSTALVEVKARYQTANMDEILPRVYFAQIPLLYVGYHDGRSQVNVIDKIETYNHMGTFERNMQEELRKVVALLGMMKTIAVNATNENLGGGNDERLYCLESCAEEACGHQNVTDAGGGVRRFAAICTLPNTRRYSNGEAGGHDGGQEVTLKVYEVPGGSEFLPADLMDALELQASNFNDYDEED